MDKASTVNTAPRKDDISKGAYCFLGERLHVLIKDLFQGKAHPWSSDNTMRAFAGFKDL